MNGITVKKFTHEELIDITHNKLNLITIGPNAYLQSMRIALTDEGKTELTFETLGNLTEYDQSKLAKKLKDYLKVDTVYHGGFVY